MLTELRDALANPPYMLTIDRIWNAYQKIEPKRTKHRTTVGMLTDIISLLRFELKIDNTLEPYSEIVNRRFKQWVFKRNAGPVQFTDEQMEWLRMIKDYIITSVKMEKEAFDYTPFIDRGGLGKFWKLFGEGTDKIINEINEELAA